MKLDEEEGTRGLICFCFDIVTLLIINLWLIKVDPFSTDIVIL